MTSNTQLLYNNSNINNSNASLLTNSKNNSKSIYQLQTSSNIFLPLPVKPKFIKNFNDVIINCNQYIFNYLTLLEVSLLRRVNKLFLNLINDYYELRLKLEINNITNFQNENEENTMLYMQNIDSQIPISNNQWLEFDLKKVTKNIELLDKKTIIQLKSIKKLTKFNQNIYAPFCIIFGYKSSNYKVKANGWKKTADLILNDPNITQKIKQLDYENFDDKDILKCFLYLNSDDLVLSKIKRFSLPFAKLIKWCQSVVSYHILIHPYKFRNKTSQIEIGSEIHKYVLFMDKIICKFYKFKRFLFKLGLVQIPLGDYVFNLQHNKVIPKEKMDLSKIINVDMIANILCYLPLEITFNFININKFGVDCFKKSLYFSCYKLLKEIIIFKLQTYEKLYCIMPILYENNIFGKYFLMLDDILNSTLDPNNYGTNYVPFLSKEHLNEIRNIKTDNKYINIICKIFCVLFDIKVEKKANQRGEIIPLYIKAVKLLAIKGTLPKLLRYYNKLELNKKQIQILINEIINLYGKNIIQDIKKISKGIYQILIWELCLFEYLKEFNPFMFIDIENIQKNLENCNLEDIQMLNYYLEKVNILKYYLKFKYHFQTLVFTNMPEAPCYEFIPMITNLLQELNNEKINISPLLDISNNDKSKTANIYFEHKDFIPINAKPAFYERIMEEIFNINEKLYINTVSNENLFNNSSYNFSYNSGDNKMNLNTNISESNNNLGMIREENAPASNIGDNQILNKYLQNKNNNIMNNINNNLNINNNNNLNDINENENEMENGGEKYLEDNNSENKININNANNYDIISCINYQNKFKIKNILENNNYFNFNEIPNNIIIKNILLYLDIKSISPFSLVNKKCNECYKINMFLRLFILDRHKTIFENQNEEYIQSIVNKRNNFFLDYEIPPPNKEHALELISQLKNKDITEIKNIYRKYNKHNEILIAPFVLLLGGKPQKTFNINGQKRMNYFSPAQKLLNDRKINQKIREINLETISSYIFREIEKLFKNEAFNSNKMKGYSPCLYHLICWEMGVIEYHRVIRYFSLNYYDFKILSKEEIIFCEQMDNINIMFNKLKYYNYKFSQKYENEANNIMKESNSDFGIMEDENENENEEIEENKKIIKHNESEEEKNSDYNNNNNNKIENNIDNKSDNNIDNKIDNKTDDKIDNNIDNDLNINYINNSNNNEDKNNVNNDEDKNNVNNDEDKNNENKDEEKNNDNISGNNNEYKNEEKMIENNNNNNESNQFVDSIDFNNDIKIDKKSDNISDKNIDVNNNNKDIDNKKNIDDSQQIIENNNNNSINNEQQNLEENEDKIENEEQDVKEEINNNKNKEENLNNNNINENDNEYQNEEEFEINNNNENELKDSNENEKEIDINKENINISEDIINDDEHEQNINNNNEIDFNNSYNNEQNITDDNINHNDKSNKNDINENEKSQNNNDNQNNLKESLNINDINDED